MNIIKKIVRILADATGVTQEIKDSQRNYIAVHIEAASWWVKDDNRKLLREVYDQIQKYGHINAELVRNHMTDKETRNHGQV